MARSDTARVSRTAVNIMFAKFGVCKECKWVSLSSLVVRNDDSWSAERLFATRR